MNIINFFIFNPGCEFYLTAKVKGAWFQEYVKGQPRGIKLRQTDSWPNLARNTVLTLS